MRRFWRSRRAVRVHLDTTTRRGSAKRNAAFTLQHGAVLTTRQPEGSVPVVVSSCAPTRGDLRNWLDRFELSLLSKPLEQQHPAEEAVRTYCPPLGEVRERKTGFNRRTKTMKSRWGRQGRIVAGAVVCLEFCGCFTAPPAQQKGSLVSYVGDRLSVTFGATVVSARVHDEGDKLCNLHLALGAIINPRDFSCAKAYGFPETRLR